MLKYLYPKGKTGGEICYVKDYYGFYNLFLAEDNTKIGAEQQISIKAELDWDIYILHGLPYQYDSNGGAVDKERIDIGNIYPLKGERAGYPALSDCQKSQPEGWLF